MNNDDVVGFWLFVIVCVLVALGLFTTERGGAGFVLGIATGFFIKGMMEIAWARRDLAVQDLLEFRRSRGLKPW